MLARAFWDEAVARLGSRATLDPATLAALARYHWPGNVRELHNAIMALAVHAPPRGRVTPSLLPATFRQRARVPARRIASASDERRWRETATRSTRVDERCRRRATQCPVREFGGRWVAGRREARVRGALHSRGAGPSRRQPSRAARSLGLTRQGLRSCWRGSASTTTPRRPRRAASEAAYAARKISGSPPALGDGHTCRG